MDGSESDNLELDFEVPKEQPPVQPTVQPRPVTPPRPIPPRRPAGFFPSQPFRQPEGFDWFKGAVLGLLVIIALVEMFMPRTTTVELSPDLNASFNPSFSPENSFSPAFNPLFNASINYTMPNATIQPTGNISWIVNNVTLVQQIVNTTVNATYRVYLCNATSFYANGTNATPCWPDA